MVMLNKEYMINHMRNENGSINIKNEICNLVCHKVNLAILSIPFLLYTNYG